MKALLSRAVYSASLWLIIFLFISSYVHSYVVATTVCYCALCNNLLIFKKTTDLVLFSFFLYFILLSFF